MADGLVDGLLRVHGGLLALSQAHAAQDEDSPDDRKQPPPPAVLSCAGASLPAAVVAAPHALLWAGEGWGGQLLPRESPSHRPRSPQCSPRTVRPRRGRCRWPAPSGSWRCWPRTARGAPRPGPPQHGWGRSCGRRWRSWAAAHRGACRSVRVPMAARGASAQCLRPFLWAGPGPSWGPGPAGGLGPEHGEGAAEAGLWQKREIKIDTETDRQREGPTGSRVSAAAERQ